MDDKALKEDIIAQVGKFHRMKKYSAKTVQVAKACGFTSIETKRFRKAKKELKDEGKIIIKGDTMELTGEMIEQLSAQQSTVEGAKSNEEHHAMIKELFADDKNYKMVCKLTDLLADGKCMTPKKAASAMGYSGTDSKGFRNAKNLLKANGYLEGTKEIKLTMEMFPFGHPLES